MIDMFSISLHPNPGCYHCGKTPVFGTRQGLALCTDCDHPSSKRRRCKTCNKPTVGRDLCTRCMECNYTCSICGCSGSDRAPFDSHTAHDNTPFVSCKYCRDDAIKAKFKAEGQIPSTVRSAALAFTSPAFDRSTLTSTPPVHSNCRSVVGEHHCTWTTPPAPPARGKQREWSCTGCGRSTLTSTRCPRCDDFLNPDGDCQWCKT